MKWILALMLTFLSFNLLTQVGSGEEPSAKVDTTWSDTSEVKYSLEPIVVTATRYPQPLSEVSSNFTLITSEQIEQTAGKDLGEVLELCPGAEPAHYGGSGQLVNLSIRGSTSEQVLFLMDGRPLNSPQNGGLDLNLIPLSSVERVEMVRGGLSSLYGANAVGGVVNIITKTFSYSRPYSRIAYWQGDWGYKRSQFELGREIGERLSFYLSGEIRSYGGYRVNSDYKANLISANFDYTLSRNWELSLSSLNYEGKLGVPGSQDFSTPNARQKDKRNDLALALKKHQGNPLGIQIYLSDSWQSYEDPDTLWPIYSTHENRLYGLSFQGMSLWPGIVFGGRGERINFWSTDIETTDVNRSSLWVEDDLKLSSRLTLRGSSRLDYHSAFGYQFSPGANLTYQIVDNSLLFASFNYSYRAPTANDLYWKDPYMSGNPKLKPERGWSSQIGFKTNSSKGNYFSANLFIRRMQDLIEWEADPQTSKYTAVNRAKAEFLGEEISLSLLPLKSFQVGAVYNILWAEDLSGSGPLHYQPFNSTRLWFDFSPTLIEGKLSLGLWTEGEWMDSRLTEWGSKLSPFFLLHTTLTINFLDLSLYLKGENLGNTGYQLRDGYPMPPRSFYGGLSWKFWD